MKLKVGIVIFILVAISAAGLLFYSWNTRPQLIKTYPAAGEASAPATSVVRLEFSRKMAEQSVLTRLKIAPSIPGNFNWEGNSLVFTPEQIWPAGEAITITLEAGGRSSSWLSFPMGSQTWSFKVGEVMLAYLWPADQPADIYALTPSTGKITRYTKDMGVLDFSASRDGLWLYFSASNAEGGADIFKIDRTKVGSEGESYQPQIVLECKSSQCRNPVISADQQYLAYEYLQPDPTGGSGPAQIWVLNLATKEASAVGPEVHETIQPGWSSKGMLAYYDVTAGGYEFISLGSQEKSFVSNQTGQPGDWNPQGEVYLAPEVSYYQAPENTERGISNLFAYTLPSGTSVDLSKQMVVEDAEGVYSPDGRQIVFARKFLDATRWSLGRQLWMMNADGSNAHPITDEADYNHYDITWSRDGNRLAYVRFDESRVFNPPELWMINVDGSDPIQLVIGGYGPIWIP